MAAPDDTAISKYTFTGTAGTDFVPASGSLSGTVSAYPGPWYVERQTLDIYYARVPVQFGASTTVDLASATTTNGSMTKTELVWYAVASYDTQISYQNFNSSSVQQPQVFTVNAASGDINGVTYGNITASTLGPMGSIVTTQPYIRRTPYIGASSQPLVSKTATGSNWCAHLAGVLSQQMSVLLSNQFVDATPYMYDLKWHKDRGCEPGTARDGHYFNTFGGVPIKYGGNSFPSYTIVGAYDTSKESLVQIENFINQVGIRVTNEEMYAWPIPNTTAGGGGLLPLEDQGFVEYDINRHA